MLEELKAVSVAGVDGVSSGSGGWRESQRSGHSRCLRQWGRHWGLVTSVRKSKVLSPRLPVSSFLALHHSTQAVWAPTLHTPCLPGVEPHLHSVPIPVSSLSYLGLSNLCGCCTWVVHVGLGGLSVFVSVKEKYYRLHWSHFF